MLALERPEHEARLYNVFGFLREQRSRGSFHRAFRHADRVREVGPFEDEDRAPVAAQGLKDVDPSDAGDDERNAMAAGISSMFSGLVTASSTSPFPAAQDVRAVHPVRRGTAGPSGGLVRTRGIRSPTTGRTSG